MDIDFNSRIKFPSDVTVQQITEGESIILNTSTENYFGLDEIGTIFYNNLINSHNINEALENIYNTYEVEKDILNNDLKNFISELLKNDLLEVETS